MTDQVQRAATSEHRMTSRGRAHVCGFVTCLIGLGGCIAMIALLSSRSRNWTLGGSVGALGYSCLSLKFGLLVSRARRNQLNAAESTDTDSSLPPQAISAAP